jgi:carbamoyl-phosphate synthase large subunit
VYDDAGLSSAYEALSLSAEGALASERPILIDRFLEDAIEVDTDAIRDASGEVLIGAVMEHVEEAGVHSGDSACVIPPPTLDPATVAVIEDYTTRIADRLGVIGPINVQYAVKDRQVFVIEANPRASRTVPFVAKATGVPLAKIAARTLVGATLAELRAEGVLLGPRTDRRVPVPAHVSVKEAVLPFDRFPGVDSLLGPEMRSTGEVMGIDRTFGLAFAKSQIAAGNRLPEKGVVFLSLADRDKRAGVEVAKAFVAMGFSLAATTGTATYVRERGIEVVTTVAKVGDGLGDTDRLEPLGAAGSGRRDRVDAVDLIERGEIQLVVNTPRGRGPRADGAHIRQAASANGVPCLTTIAAARAAAAGIADWGRHSLQVRSLQEHHRSARESVVRDVAHGGHGAAR